MFLFIGLLLLIDAALVISFDGTSSVAKNKIRLRAPVPQTRLPALLLQEQSKKIRLDDASAACATVAWDEVSIDSDSSSPSVTCEQQSSIGQRIKNGESVVAIRDIVSPDECSYIIESCIETFQQAGPTEFENQGLIRLPTISAAERANKVALIPCANPVSNEVDALLQTILLRVATYIDGELPSISRVLFPSIGDGDNTGGESDDSQDDSYEKSHGWSSLTEQLQSNSLKYTHREPAINVYSKGGKFLSHKDAQALTVLIPLSSSTDSHNNARLSSFTGGGTGFWSQDARGHRVEGPTMVLKPPAGTAMLFGGCVTHSGIPVESGCRIVFVASFSPKNGLYRAPNMERDVYGDLL